jgi:hypothetical protein
MRRLILVVTPEAFAKYVRCIFTTDAVFPVIFPK